MEARSVSVLRSIDWLIVLLVSWVLPLGFVPALEVTYFNSLAFWIVPIAALLPRFLGLTHAGSRRRRALGWATAGGGVFKGWRTGGPAGPPCYFTHLVPGRVVTAGPTYQATQPRGKLRPR